MSWFMSPYDREFEELAKERKEAYQQGYDKANDEWLERLDKIRDEIEQARYGLVNDGLDIALNILDKYKAEQEE